MATTIATVGITSADLMPGMALNISATSTLMQTGTTTGLELIDMGAGALTEASLRDMLHNSLGTADTANWVYLCNTSTNVEQYIKVGIHETVIGNLGSGEWMWMPWNMGTAANEINIEAETSGTITYEYAIFKSTYTNEASTPA
tara:strand:+ start:804 stop:1235 length:432 start_codon:yes stop_codon:yes gene_type:complete